MVGQLFGHVVIAVLEREGDDFAAVFFVDDLRSVLHHLLASLKGRAVMVAHDVMQLGVFYVALHHAQVEEAFVALRQPRNIGSGEQTVEFHRDERGVNHRVFGRTGMDAQSLENHIRRAGVERLVGDFAFFAAVHRVGVICAELGDVEVIHARADFLIRRESDAELPVRGFACDDGFQRGHDLRDAGLVVRAEQGGAVRGDERHADQLFQAGERRGAERFAASGQKHVAAVVMLDDLRLHVFAGAIRRGVEVGDEAERGLLLAARRRGQPAVDDAVFVNVDVFKAEGFQLIDEDVRQIVLAHGAGDGGAVRVGGGVDRNIFEQTFVSAHENRSPL